MQKNGREIRCCCTAIVFPLVALLAPAPAPAQVGISSVRLVQVVEKAAVARALDHAVARIQDPACEGLLDEFTDAAGNPLRAGLAALGVDAPEYLGRMVFFYDGTQAVCGTSALAVTAPGSRAVFVCGARFLRQITRDPRHAEATLIHEALHSLGLGENPPSSDHINERIRARCWR